MGAPSDGPEGSPGEAMPPPSLAFRCGLFVTPSHSASSTTFGKKWLSSIGGWGFFGPGSVAKSGQIEEDGHFYG